MRTRPLAILRGCGIVMRIKGSSEELRRLISLGFAPGRKVRVHINGSVIVVEVDNSILVMDHQLASKIMVGDQYED
ncbi:MAG TPA: ferrous iron transport protein A [Thermofilum sp.]|nr:ferrous iron transport protein A [Thermofilum sp.]